MGHETQNVMSEYCTWFIGISSTSNVLVGMFPVKETLLALTGTQGEGGIDRNEMSNV